MRLAYRSSQTRTHPVDATSFALLSISIFFWGTAFRAHAVGPEYTSALTFAALRASAGAIVLFMTACAIRSPMPNMVNILWAITSGFFMVTVVLVGASVGTVQAGAADAAVLANTTPFFVLLLSRLFLRERSSLKAFSGLVVGFSGVVLMVSSQLASRPGTGHMVVGMCFALLAAFGWGSGTLIVKRVLEREPRLDLLSFTTVQYIAGALSLVALALAFPDTGTTNWSATPLWLAVGWVAVGSSALASITYFAGLKRITATAAASWLFLVPVVAVVVEVVRGKAPDAPVLAGMGLTVLDAIIASREGSQPEPGTRIRAVSDRGIV